MSSITCRELVDFLMDYDNGELSETERSTFSEHLRLCPPCEAYLESYRETVRLGRAVCSDPEGAPPDCPDALVQAILAARQSASD